MAKLTAMAVRTLNPRSALTLFLSHIRYTQSRLQAHALAAPHAVEFKALRDQWATVHAEELAILEETSDAQARVDSADDALNAFASRFSKAVLIITNDDRKSPLYVHFFGKLSLSEFNRPTLGNQLSAMKKWVPSLQTSNQPTLKVMLPELEALVSQADAAVAARASAQQKRRQFRDLGGRRVIVDALNAKRKVVHGALAALVFNDPALPSDFADRFFLTEGAEGEVEALTVASQQARITELEQQLQAEKQVLAALVAEQEAEAQAALQKQADEAALAALEKQMSDLAKQAADLQAKLAGK